MILSSCALADVPGTGPLRYRDQIFESVTKTANVTYGSAPNKAGDPVTLKMDIYQPAGDSNIERPVIVMVHGGFFCCGDKDSSEIVDQANVFAKKGYVTASIDYRLRLPGCTQDGPDCPLAAGDATHDAQAAVRFFRRYASTYGVDPHRIAISGTSAGAIVALAAAYRSDDPGTSGNPGFPSTVRAAVSLSGAEYGPEAIGAGDAPALAFHGTADTLVPYAVVQDDEKAAREAGLEFYLVAWEGEGHVPYAEHREQILNLTTNFLYRKLDVLHAGES